MAKRLIDADALKAELLRLSFLPALVKTAIDRMPDADAVEVVHGHWENVTGGMIELGDCSECKKRQPSFGTNYCHNCGAKMDGGKDER